MNNHVSKEVAIALKGAGFGLNSYFYYWILPHKLTSVCASLPSNFNARELKVSAPDFLTAADWLWDKHGIGITFMPIMSSYETDSKDYTVFSALKFPDHRNEALLFALNQIKK